MFKAKLNLLPLDLEKVVLSYLNYQDLVILKNNPFLSQESTRWVEKRKKQLLFETPWCLCVVYEYSLIQPIFYFVGLYIGSDIPENFQHQNKFYAVKSTDHPNDLSNKCQNSVITLPNCGKLLLHYEVGGPLLKQFLQQGTNKKIYLDGSTLGKFTLLKDKSSCSKDITKKKISIKHIKFGHLINYHKQGVPVYTKKKRHKKRKILSPKYRSVKKYKQSIRSN